LSTPEAVRNARLRALTMTVRGATSRHLRDARLVIQMDEFDAGLVRRYPVAISPGAQEHPLRIATSPAERVNDRQPRSSIARITP
jgi:hypothetical protein